MDHAKINNKTTIRLRGQIERITFVNEDNGFTIAKVRVFGQDDLVTVTGTLISPTPGEVLEMQGEWVMHPRYGEQFKITDCKTAIPATIYGIQKYLGSGLVKGIGPVMAKRIVKKFGKDTLDIIEEDPDRLMEVEGIGKKRIEMIREAWKEQKEIRKVMLFLQGHGISSGYATKIFKQYGDRAIQIVTENPYRLANDIFGIGFVTADSIASKLGFPKDSQMRIESGIIYVLQKLANEGHVYYPYKGLIKKSIKILAVDRDIIETALTSLALKDQIVIKDLGEDSKSSDETKAVYLSMFHLCETAVAEKLISLLNAPKGIRKADSKKALEWVQKELALSLAEKQTKAVLASMENKVMIITGGPGTGKTTIINAILKIFLKLTDKVMLAAPTGRAAKRMSETTGYEAKTIHRMLEFSMREKKFKKDELDPLECDMLIIDEASMIDTVLMYNLLKAVPPEATLILVGDVNQLPSVGAGNILKDIINSNILPVVELNEIFRQAKESKIIINAHRINKGQMPLFDLKDQANDFFFFEQNDPQKLLETIVDLVKTRIPKKFAFDPINEIQVLSPMRRGIVGTGNLNTRLQEALNPSGKTLSRGTKKFRINDKVMQIKNNYDKEVFNGDMGQITDINHEEQEVTVQYDRNYPVHYDFSELDEIVLAYAVSVHKSQGSEYPAVVIPLVTQHYILLQRNLIYTAVTRGQKLVVLAGTKKALVMGIKNNKTQRRYTNLANILRSLSHQADYDSCSTITCQQA